MRKKEIKNQNTTKNFQFLMYALYIKSLYDCYLFSSSYEENILFAVFNNNDVKADCKENKWRLDLT